MALSSGVLGLLNCVFPKKYIYIHNVVMQSVSCHGNVISNFVFTTIAANLIKTTVIINSFSSSLWKKELVVQPKDRLQFLFVV